MPLLLSFKARICSRCLYSTVAAPQIQRSAEEINLLGKSYPTDEWTNVSRPIIDTLSRKLHLQQSHPIGILRNIIEARFPSDKYTRYTDFPPIVTTKQNFDSLGIPLDHPGRSRTDTYYVNAKTVLRTHTSAHQAETFRSCPTPGFLISADVYRRDSIDRSHYPSFHQMEGAMTWPKSPGYASPAEQIEKDIAALPKLDLVVEDPMPAFHDKNPKQPQHSDAESIAISTHLKRTLEGMVEEIFGRARAAAGTTSDERLRVRWIDAYFPFTSPSYELEVLWEGQWLELLGCGVVAQPVLENAGTCLLDYTNLGAPNKVGWAFGIGLDRLAMVLFGVPDIRLFWSTDPRFLKQFSPGTVSQFTPFSKYPECYKDVAFWLNDTSVSAAGGGQVSKFHENDLMELLREEAGDLIEDVHLVDEFRHPKTGRKSLCYRINYRSMER